METLRRQYADIGSGDSKDIFEAVLKNDCKFIFRYMDEGGDLNIIDERKETLLHKASRNNYFEVVDVLIKAGLDVNAQNRYGDTPLHLAVQFRNAYVVYRLLFEGANVNLQNHKKVTPLHIAAARGNIEILNILLDNKAKFNLADENGAKAIHYGVKSGKDSIIRHLLNNGASLNDCDDRKNTVLHYACDKGDDALVAFILRHLTVNDSRNIYLETPLHIAAEKCSLETVKLLLNNGYNPLALNRNGQTPADVAKAKGRGEIAEFLTQYLRSEDYKEKFAKYPLHRAACNNQYEVLVQMLDSSQINEFDFFGKSLMYYAVNIGSLKMVDYLWKRGARINSVDEFRQSALLIAIYNEDLPMIEYLLKKNANVSEIFYGRSYLYRAVLRNNYELAKMLIDYGANVNEIDSRHRTIYSYALEFASDEIIELLVEKKASLV